MKLYGVAILFAVMSSMAFAQGVDLSLKGKQVIRHADIELSNHQKSALKKFTRRANFFAAIAVNPTSRSEKAMAAVWNINGIKVAQDMAIRFCQLKTKQPDQCILLASVVPENMPANSALTTLSAPALVDFKKFLTRWNVGKYSAFAKSDLWSAGWVLNRDTQKQAQTDALKYCEEHAAGEGKGQVHKTWRNALIDPGKKRCRVIFVGKPQ